MNVGLNDAWYDPVTNGQGFFITVFPEIEYVSLSWFTYDTEHPPEGVTANLGEPGHRWLMALGTYSENQAVMDISITSGGIFDTPTEVAPVTEVYDGTIILTFNDCESGTVEYDIPSINQQGTVPIQRVVGDNISFCEILSQETTTQQNSVSQKRDTNSTLSFQNPKIASNAPLLSDMNVGLNDAWFNPVTNGQGFFINVFPNIEYVSLSWFTYDTERPPEDVTANLGEPGHRWLMALGTYSGNQAVMDISITSGGLFDTPTEVTGISEVYDGTIILTLADCESGTVEYDISSINQQGTVPIQRVVGDNIALCEELSSPENKLIYEIEYNDERDFATVFELGDTVTGSLSISSDVDWFAVDIDSQNTGMMDVNFDVSASNNGSWNVNWYDLGMVSMTGKNISAPDGVQYQFPAYTVGTYYLRIQVTEPVLYSGGRYEVELTN